MAKKFLTYQGERMVEGWPERIQEDQKHATVLIHGLKYERVRYGSEHDDWGADQHGCHDCRVIKGQIHVWGCDGEECPKCGGQVISCDCEPERL